MVVTASHISPHLLGFNTQHLTPNMRQPCRSGRCMKSDVLELPCTHKQTDRHTHTHSQHTQTNRQTHTHTVVVTQRRSHTQGFIQTDRHTSIFFSRSHLLLLTSIPRRSVDTIVESTGVAKVLSLGVPTPEGRGRRSAVAPLTAGIARVADPNSSRQLTCACHEIRGGGSCEKTLAREIMD